MKNIYFIRHGETKWNTIGKIQGWKDSRLTDLGIKQANKAAEYLNKYESTNIDIIYSSDLSRAYDTAEIINNKLKLDIIESELLRENSFGIWEGKTKEDILEFDSKGYENWLRIPEESSIEDGETLDELRKRVKKFLDSIVDYENILIVSHSVTIKMLILVLLNMDNKHFKNLSMNNTGISKIEVKDYNTVLKYYNSTTHLKGEYNG